MIFEQALSSEWKKGSIASIYAKPDKKNIKNYFPTYLVLISCKIFERLIFNDLFN